jgi:hypothetical protein
LKWNRRLVEVTGPRVPKTKKNHSAPRTQLSSSRFGIILVGIDESAASRRVVRSTHFLASPPAVGACNRVCITSPHMFFLRPNTRVSIDVPQHKPPPKKQTMNLLLLCLATTEDFEGLLTQHTVSIVRRHIVSAILSQTHFCLALGPCTGRYRRAHTGYRYPPPTSGDAIARMTEKDENSGQNYHWNGS